MSRIRLSTISMCVWNRENNSVPPMYDWTPNQITAITTLLRTGQNDPQIPKDARAVTGNEIWYTAPIRPVR